MHDQKENIVYSADQLRELQNALNSIISTRKLSPQEELLYDGVLIALLAYDDESERREEAAKKIRGWGKAVNIRRLKRRIEDLVAEAARVAQSLERFWKRFGLRDNMYDVLNRETKGEYSRFIAVKPSRTNNLDDLRNQLRDVEAEYKTLFDRGFKPLYAWLRVLDIQETINRDRFEPLKQIKKSDKGAKKVLKGYVKRLEDYLASLFQKYTTKMF